MSTARRYAADTSVSIDRSKQQLERLLRDRGAEGFAVGWDAKEDRIEFLWRGLQIRFILPRASLNQATQRAREQADRQRWRALYLVVRAKIEAIESGIAVFEQEFLGFIVNPQTNTTIYEHAVPMLKAGQWQSALPPGRG